MRRNANELITSLPVQTPATKAENSRGDYGSEYDKPDLPPLPDMASLAPIPITDEMDRKSSAAVEESWSPGGGFDNGDENAEDLSEESSEGEGKVEIPAIPLGLPLARICLLRPQ